MKVIILKTGEVKDVPDGYARNFLIPKKQAVSATPEALADLEKKQAQDRASAAELAAAHQALKKQLKNAAIHIEMKANPEGTLFGALPASAILEAFKQQGIELQEQWVSFPTVIKTIGGHQVQIRIPNLEPIDIAVEIRSI